MKRSVDLDEVQRRVSKTFSGEAAFIGKKAGFYYFYLKGSDKDKLVRLCHEGKVDGCFDIGEVSYPV